MFDIKKPEIPGVPARAKIPEMRESKIDINDIKETAMDSELPGLEECKDLAANIWAGKINTNTGDFSALQRCPKEGSGGKWAGERGNSNWVPENDEVPKNPRFNKNELTWEEMKEKYNFNEIPFKDGEPDFSEVSKGNVEILNFTENRERNFAQADEELAKQKGCTPEEVKQWREDNKYTWHECGDCGTMQKVPSEVHGNIPHEGGIAAIKSQRNQGGNE